MADVPRNMDNTFFRRENHVLLAKEDKTRALVLDSGVTRATSLGKIITSGARGGFPAIPANAIRDRAGNPIQTRAGANILLRS